MTGIAHDVVTSRFFFWTRIKAIDNTREQAKQVKSEAVSVWATAVGRGAAATGRGGSEEFNTMCGCVYQKNEVEMTWIAEFLCGCQPFKNGSLSVRCSGHNLLSTAI